MPRNDGSLPGLQSLPARADHTKNDSSGLHKSPGETQVMPAEQAGELPPPMGSAQLPFSESGAYARLSEQGIEHAVLEMEGMETPPPVQMIWSIFGEQK